MSVCALHLLDHRCDCDSLSTTTGKTHLTSPHHAAPRRRSLRDRFKTLSHLTNKYRWWRLAERPMSAIRSSLRTGASDGLLPIFLNPRTGKFVLSDVRLGSRGDSYYEYLVKQWLITKCVAGHVSSAQRGEVGL